MESNLRSGKADLLSPQPRKLTKQEIEHMEALARIMYSVYAREQRAEKTEKLAPAVSLDVPRVFTATSTARN
jgi:hypothetical protein